MKLIETATLGHVARCLCPFVLWTVLTAGVAPAQNAGTPAPKGNPPTPAACPPAANRNTSPSPSQAPSAPAVQSESGSAEIVKEDLLRTKIELVTDDGKRRQCVVGEERGATAQGTPVQPAN